MRERKLIQRRTHAPRRRRLGFSRVERPGQLWHLDMTSIWVAEHGWVHLNAIIDSCTCETRHPEPLPPEPASGRRGSGEAVEGCDDLVLRSRCSDASPTVVGYLAGGE